MDLKSIHEANDLLSNGILVETSDGLICMSLDDALSCTDLNLSGLQNVAAQLLMQDEAGPCGDLSTPGPGLGGGGSMLLSSDGLGDSDGGFTSESSAIPQQSTMSGGDNIISLSMDSGEVEFNNSNVSDSDGSSNVVRNTAQSSTGVGCGSANMSSSVLKSPAPAAVAKAAAVKKRGGWPKGRKRKAEFRYLPPKAPATGYNLYLNEQRQLLSKTYTLPFHEMTKLIGNKWSNLSLAEKNPYLQRAEEEKRRYREEFRVYRQSGAYQLYLANKRRKRAKYNVMSESDMDATDDIDEEDNEELYCRTCDQWFHNMHNKREHLQGRQHMQAIVGAIRSELESDHYVSTDQDADYDDTFANSYVLSSVSMSTSLDESSLDATTPCITALLNPVTVEPSVASTTSNAQTKSGVNVSDSISNLLSVIQSRDREIKLLRGNVQQNRTKNSDLQKEYSLLKAEEVRLKARLEHLKNREGELETNFHRLWQLPTWFVVNSSVNTPLTSNPQ